MGFIWDLGFGAWDLFRASDFKLEAFMVWERHLAAISGVKKGLV